MNGDAAYAPSRLSTLRAYPLGRLLDLTLTLAATEFKLRYYGKALGYVWALAKPLLLFGVLYLAFTKVIHFGGGISHYPVYLLTGIVLFNYFSETTSRSVSSMVEREMLVRKMPIPLVVIPVAVSLTAIFNLVLEVGAVFVFILASGIDPAWSWLELVPLIALLIVFATAVSTLLANLFVPFRDTGAIWEVLLQLLFWGTPVVYTVSFLPDSLERWAMFNPLGAIVTQVRHAVIDPHAPSAAQAAGGAAWLLVPLALIAILAALSVALHQRMAPRLAERL